MRIALAGLALTCSLTCCSAREEPAAPIAAELFGDRVHAFELLLEPDAMAELAREPRDWVRGALRAYGQRYDDVGVRFKGHRTLRGWSEKPAFKLDFKRYKKGRRVFGLDVLALDNMVEDPTMLRQALASRFFAALQVPASRTGFAELKVNGRRFGLYALIEAIEPRFLARHFTRADGPLYEGEYGCDVYTNDVWAMKADGDGDPGRRELFALARAAEGSPRDWLFGASPQFSTPAFLNYLAASALLGDFDGYRHAHNYQLYRDPARRLWSFIPWGFDRVLKKRTPVFESHGRLARACFDDERCRLEYVKALHGAAERFERLGLAALAEHLDARITPAVKRDPRRPHSDSERAEALAELRAFIRERPAEVRREAACWDGAHERDRDADGAGCRDCDDADPAVHPGAVELCGDGKDNDCSGQVDDAPSCECHPLQVAEARFSVCGAKLPYDGAHAFCRARGQQLAHFDGAREAKAVSRAAQAQHASAYWIGLSDRGDEGSYRWLTGGRPSRRLWAKGEPDPYVCGQDCAALREGGRGRLRDLHCATPLPFVCRDP